MRYFWRRIWAMFGEAAADRDLEMELESHLEMRTQDFIRRGMTPEAARREARIELEADQLVRGGASGRRADRLETIGLWRKDSRAMRALGRAKGFTALAVLTLSTGIGINTAVFSVFNAAALRPIQAVAPERVMQLAHAGRDPSFSSREYLAYRDLSRSFTSLAAVTNRVFSMSGAPGAAAGQAGGIAAAAGIEFPRALGAVRANGCAGGLRQTPLSDAGRFGRAGESVSAGGRCAGRAASRADERQLLGAEIRARPHDAGPQAGPERHGCDGGWDRAPLTLAELRSPCRISGSRLVWRKKPR